MASDNRAYTQFENATGTPAPHYGSTAPPATGGQVFRDENETKILKKWKNSRRLCWILLILGIVTTILEIIGAGISGVHIDWILGRFVAGVWLAALGVISAALGLRAFRNPHESSKCWTISHFVMGILSTIAYAILILIASTDIVWTHHAIQDFHLIEDYEEQLEEEIQNSTASNTNVTSTATTPYDDSGDQVLLNAIKGDLSVSVFLLGTTIAFFIISIIANIIICHKWCRNSEKTMTIVYMPQDPLGSPQTQSVVIPAKSQVVVVPAPKSGQAENQAQLTNQFNKI